MWIPPEQRLRALNFPAFISRILICFLWVISITTTNGFAQEQSETLHGLMLQQGSLTLVTDSQDTSLLRQAADQVEKITEDIYVLTRLRRSDSLTIYFLNNLHQVRKFIPTAPTWSGGLTTDPNTLYVYDSDPVEWLATLRHELTHVLVAQNNLTLPVWFNEGLAQYVAGKWSWSGYLALGNAVLRSDVIPLSDLDMVLTYSRQKAELGYAESLGAFKYMLERQGRSILPILLTSDDRTFKERYQAASQETLLDFEIGWREDLSRSYAFYKLVKFPDILWLAMPFIVLIGYFLMRWRNRKKIRQWEIEEGWELHRGEPD